MIRQAPDGHLRQGAMSRATTRLSRRAPLQRGEVGRDSAGAPCWRGVGVMAPRRLLGTAKPLGHQANGFRVRQPLIHVS